MTASTSSPTSAPAPRLRLLCHAVRVAAILGVLLLLLPQLSLLTASDDERLAHWLQAAGLLPDTLVTMAPFTGWIAAVLLALPLAVSVLGLWQLWQLFGAFASGEALTTRALHHLRRFALAILAGAVLQPVARAALSVVLTMGNPEGRRMLLASFSSDSFFLILLGAVFLAITIVMSDAVRAVDENRSFV